MASLVGWSEENMKKAIEAVNNSSMSQMQAAFAFGVIVFERYVTRKT